MPGEQLCLILLRKKIKCYKYHTSRHIEHIILYYELNNIISLEKGV